MLFSYKAIKDNQRISRQIEADNELAVLAHLKENDYFPIEIRLVHSNRSGVLDKLLKRVTFTDIVDFTRQFAIMLNAGLTIVDSLEILQKQVGKPQMKSLIADIGEQIKAGNPLSRVLRNYPNYFSNLYIALVRSGEASGKLSEILLQLSDNLEKEREFKSKLKNALIYPMIIVIAMVSVMFIMVTFVVPKMLSLYKDFKVELPLPTKILLAISTFSAQFWPIIIVVVFGTVFAIRKYGKTKRGKYLYDSLILRLPIFNNIIKKASLVDSTRTLAVLSGAGVSLLEALTIVIETTTNALFKEAFQNVYKNIEKGKSFGGALSYEEIFPPIFIQMAIVGENTGHLDDTLLRLSHYFEFESESAIKTITALIEPTILVVLGFGVAFLVLAVITPIYKLTESFQ